MNQKLALMLQKLSWIPGAIFGFVFPWEKLAESAITLITSCTITFITFFLTRWLSKKYPSKEQ